MPLDLRGMYMDDPLDHYPCEMGKHKTPVARTRRTVTVPSGPLHRSVISGPPNQALKVHEREARRKTTDVSVIRIVGRNASRNSCLLTLLLAAIKKSVARAAKGA